MKKYTKKIIALLLALTLCFGILASCNSGGTGSLGNEGGSGEVGGGSGDGGGDALPLGGLPEGMDGKTAASLILANERLNSQLLNNSQNIFDEGVNTLTALARQASESIAKYTVVTDPKIAAAALASAEIYECSDGSTVEVDGNTYRWQGFSEYSNSYDYFLNLTGNITSSAKSGAALIDNTKRYVRVVDKWVDVGGNQYYLHVEENRELLIERNQHYVGICIRYKNDDGDNVYETFHYSDVGTMRMVYIAGKRCEYSYVTDGEFNHNFSAINTKGYWEVVDVYAKPQTNSYGVSCMVIKDDICYDAYHDPNYNIGDVSIISADRATDIMDISLGDYGLHISVHLQAFEGLDYAIATAEPDKVLNVGESALGAEIFWQTDSDGSTSIFTNAEADLTFVFENGKTLKKDDVIANGDIQILGLWISHFSKEPEPGSYIYGDGYAPKLDLYVRGDGYADSMAKLRAFLNELGLTSRHDLDYVESGALRAFSELSQFVKYHEWNESPIYTAEDIARGWQNNLAKHAALKKIYEDVKDVEVIDMSDEMTYELNISFAPIAQASALALTNDALRISADALALTVNDTLLFVVGDEYTVGFALLPLSDEGAGLIHLAGVETAKVKYNDTDSFTVTTSAELDLPALAVGEYTLVAYVASADGIRTSEYAPLAFTDVADYEVINGRTKTAVSGTQNGNLHIAISEVVNVEIKLDDATVAHTQTTLTEELSRAIFDFAFVAEGAVLEVMGDGEGFTPVADGAEPLASGIYRLKYSVENGENKAEGYAFVNYTAPALPTE